MQQIASGKPDFGTCTAVEADLEGRGIKDAVKCGEQSESGHDIMADNSNTIAGWVLAAGIVALGTSIVFGKVFHSEVPVEG